MRINGANLYSPLAPALTKSSTAVRSLALHRTVGDTWCYLIATLWHCAESFEIVLALGDQINLSFIILTVRGTDCVLPSHFDGESVRFYCTEMSMLTPTFTYKFGAAIRSIVFIKSPTASRFRRRRRHVSGHTTSRASAACGVSAVQGI